MIYPTCDEGMNQRTYIDSLESDRRTVSRRRIDENNKLDRKFDNLTLQSQFWVMADSEIVQDTGGRQDIIDRLHITLSEEVTGTQPNKH